MITPLPAPCHYLEGSVLPVPEDAACSLLAAGAKWGRGFPRRQDQGAESSLPSGSTAGEGLEALVLAGPG